MSSKNNKLFVNKNIDQKKETPIEALSDLGQTKNTQKFGDTKIGGLSKELGLTDIASSTLSGLEGIAKSAKDTFKSKGKRNGNSELEGSGKFEVEDRSIANRHEDAISGILGDTFDGNLFDAGVSALNLLNFGTKWKMVLDQYVDKDSYPFRYWYYTYDVGGGATSIEKQFGGLGFLDSIEDPTILTFSLKIDYRNSPLFMGLEELPTEKEIENSSPTSIEKDFGNTQKSENIENNFNNSAISFINRYKAQHKELKLAEDYLREFDQTIKSIFVSPESIGNKDDLNYKKLGHKNHYIQEIVGLDKLDNHFVEYGEDMSNHEHLVLKLSEDVRMYVNRMAFLYRNLTWSYNMGKKLITENKLRFNLYIKISEMRNYTSSFDEEINDIVRNGYSRVIYELKDCEFIFDKSLNPSTLSVSSFDGGVNDSYADLSIKIKYRKVNRIFYSEMYSRDDSFVIGDKFYEPNTGNYLTDLKDIGFHSKNTQKRQETSNNIAVEQSLGERLDRLKNKGLYTEDDDDTAVGRFVKGIGNEAVKSGASLVDEGITKFKDKANNQLNNVNDFFGKDFSNGIRDLVNQNSKNKTTDLGNLHGDTNFERKEPVRDLHPETNFEYNAPSEILHGEGISVSSPNEILHGDGQGIEAPDELLHGDGQDIIEPNEILHGDGQGIEAPDEVLHGDGQDIETPDELLHGDGQDIIEPNEILHGEGQNIESPDEMLGGEGSGITQPNEALHSEGQDIEAPSEILHGEGQSIEAPEDVLHGEGNGITQPSEILHGESQSIEAPDEMLGGEGSGITDPNVNLHNNVPVSEGLDIENVNEDDNNNENKIESPSENVNSSEINPISKPDENLHDNFTKFIRKDPPSNGKLDEC